MYARQSDGPRVREKSVEWGAKEKKESSKREEDGAIGVGNSEQWSGVVVGAVTLWQGGCVSCGV